MLEELKKKVYEANMELQEKKLVIYTWGNVSEIDRKTGLVEFLLIFVCTYVRTCIYQKIQCTIKN